MKPVEKKPGFYSYSASPSMHHTEILNQVKDELRRRKYGKSTIGSYISACRLLFEFFPDRDLRELKKQDFLDLSEYLLERRNLSAATVHQTLMGIRFLYARVFKSAAVIRTIPLPPRRRAVQEILEPKEVLDILNATDNIKHRTLLMLIYASGLKLNEALRLRPEDVDTAKRLVNIRKPDGRLARQAVLSDEFNKQLHNYLSTHNPQQWLFFGRTTAKPLSMRSAQHIFDAAAIRAGIKKDVSINDLRHAFAGHLLQTGADLGMVQRALGLRSYASAQYYQPLTSRNIPNVKSPLDTVLSGEAKVIADTADFESSLTRVKDPDVRHYLNEAIVCFKNGALRAGVVFVWTAAMLNIQSRCLSKRVELNRYIQLINPDAKLIRSMSDFAYFKDKTILLATQELGIYGKTQREILEQCLDLRNKCGHPSKYSPRANRVAAFLDELVDLVFS